jgi:hypothetical protein
MKALLSVVGVFGLAAVFGFFEPASASHRSVTSEDVRLVSEEMPLVSEQTSSDDVSRSTGRRGGRQFRRKFK